MFRTIFAEILGFTMKRIHSGWRRVNYWRFKSQDYTSVDYAREQSEYDGCKTFSN